jgi:hypothetical protein
MLDESDEESKSNLIAQALPVAQISSKSIDFSLPPATGEEYLLRVRHEASKEPIVVANVNLKKYESKRTAQYVQQVAQKKYFPCHFIRFDFILLNVLRMSIRIIDPNLSQANSGN